MLTTVTPSSGKPFTTLERLKLELQIADTDETEDLYLEELLAEVSAAIEDHCGQTFGRRTVRETMRTTQTHTLVVEVTPVVSVASVKYRGELVPQTDYYLADSACGFIYAPNGWHDTGRYTHGLSGAPVAQAYDYEIEYTAGYILPGDTGTTLPRSIQSACLLWAKARFFARGRDPGIVSEKVLDILSNTYSSDDVPPEVRKLLEPYVRTGI